MRSDASFLLADDEKKLSSLMILGNDSKMHSPWDNTPATNTGTPKSSSPEDEHNRIQGTGKNHPRL